MDAQAVMLIGPGKVELREVSVPEPRAGEVQVRSLANGICMGEVVQFTDVLQLPCPRPLGHEGIGVVTQIGAEVERLREGDYVTIWNDSERSEKTIAWTCQISSSTGSLVKTFRSRSR